MGIRGANINPTANPTARGATVILLSGGIESSTLLYLERDRSALFPVFIDYAQQAARREYACADWQCRQLDLPLKTLDMSAVGESFRAGQERHLHVPVPHRNLVITSVALSYAAHIGASRLCLALNREDRTAYASASAPFIAHLRALAATLGPFAVDTPLGAYGKAEVIGLGLGLGVDYAHTYSCLLGHPRQCGACPQCEKRRTAFAAHGLDDPAGFKASPA